MLLLLFFLTINNSSIVLFSNKFRTSTVHLAETQVQDEENGCNSCSSAGNLSRSRLQTPPRRDKKSLPTKRNGNFGFYGWLGLAVYQRSICRHSSSRRGRPGGRASKTSLQCGSDQNLAKPPLLPHRTLPREPRDCLK